MEMYCYSDFSVCILHVYYLNDEQVMSWDLLFQNLQFLSLLMAGTKQIIKKSTVSEHIDLYFSFNLYNTNQNYLEK